jgi:hypothetical protein
MASPPAQSSELTEPAAKKARRRQKFLPAYSTQYPVLRASSQGPYYALCTVCGSDFSVSHGGLNDCVQHIKGVKHQKYCAAGSSGSMTNFLVQKETALSLKTTKAELLWTGYLTEHNISTSASDHAGDLFRAMFPDSEVAKKFTCARTKATALIDHSAKVCLLASEYCTLSSDFHFIH